MCNFLLYYYNVSRVNKTEGSETRGILRSLKEPKLSAFPTEPDSLLSIQ